MKKIDNTNTVTKLFRTKKHIKKYYSHIATNALLLDSKQYLDIKNASENVTSLLEKTVKLFFKFNKVKSFFSLNAKQQKIIKNYNAKQRSLYLGRYDGFIDDNNNFKFLEFNINFPGGIDRLDAIAEVILNYQKNNGTGDIKNYNHIKQSFIKTVTGLYKKYAKNNYLAFCYGAQTEPKNIASLEAIAELLSAHGIKTVITHWKDLSYNNKNVLFKNKKIGLIFKAALLQRIWQYDYKYFQNIITALEAKQVYMFNLPQAYICGAKNLFALWHEKWFLQYLNKKEIQTINDYIPETYLLNNESLIKKILSSKDKWVLKPVEGIGGRAVYVGKALTDSKWQKVINIHSGDSKWIVQKFIKTKKHLVIDLDTKTEKIIQKECYLNVSPWVFDGKLAGISVRYSDDLVVNVAKGGGIMTSFVK